MDATTLKHILKSVLEGYSGEGLNGYSYLTQDPDENVFTSVSVGQIDGHEITFVDLLVRFVGEHVVIVEDRNSEPLVEALLDAKVPRNQIILAYRGEPVPESA